MSYGQISDLTLTLC